MDTLITIIIAAIVVLAPLGVLVLYGVLGPSWLRSKMKRVLNFFDRDSALFFPYDHAKPSKEAIEDMVKNWWPTQRRAKSALRLIGLYVLIAVVSVIVSVIIIAFAALIER